MCILAILYGSTLTIENFSYENFPYPVWPTADIDDIIPRLAGTTSIIFSIFLYKKDIKIDWGCIAYYN
ncbi:MAG: hypothetical protein WC875_03340 [Candidatus Absconditabacterales bacterium]|jgi:hypothetical protein